jgi:molecular chaperone HtpG
MTAQRHEFQAEVKQLLDLMVHSLYSDKDIFLRELISNASDALDKLRFEQLTKSDVTSVGELHLRLETDKANRTLSIIDNGIGMSRDEVVKNIGTIAKSGTREFLTAVKNTGGKDVPPELIGQFGVGFYSAFMVADKIELVTRRAGQDVATRWESAGDGSYTLGEAERGYPGTTVTLHLKPVDAERGLRDYTDEHVLAEIVKRYSDFVAYPIRIKRWKTDTNAQVIDDDTLNSMKAIWDRPKGEVSEQEYKDFYRHLTHDWTDPLRTVPVKIEGTLEAYALLYVPSKPPFDLYSPEMKRGLQLYVKRVFVMDECKELMPPYLRFVRGVVDAHDLSLNVSREILQKDRQIQLIRKQLVKKVLATLEETKRDKHDDYAQFWSAFGPVLKEGMLAPDADKEKLLDLVVTASTDRSAPVTSLEQYVGRMKEGQDAIYFLTGPSKEALAKSPLLERFIAGGYEVLLFSDPVDELWLEQGLKYKDKPLKSIARGDIVLGSEDERKQATEQLEDKKKELSDLLGCLRVHLQDHVKEVRLSHRMTSSLACLVADEHDLSPRVQRMLEHLGQAPPKTKPVLEINPSHPVVEKLKAVFQASHADPRLAIYAQLLYGQAHLAESGYVADPHAFGDALVDLMARAL